MTTEDIVTSYTPIFTHDLNGGVQKLYRFANGFGASVIRGPFSYGGPSGLWELAVVVFGGDTWELTYDTAITDDVIGHQSEAEIADLLRRIDGLDANGQELEDEIEDAPLAIEGGAK